jgi:hypothetical protein
VARVDAPCSDLASPAILDPLFADPVALAPASQTDEYIGVDISDSYLVRQNGGVACWWMSADAIVTSEGAFDSQYATVEILPATTSDFAAFSTASAGGADHRTDCSYGHCQYDRLTPNGWWLAITANGLPYSDDAATTALANPVFAAIAATVAALPSPATPWSAPTPAIALPNTCDGIISGADLSSSVGISGAAIAEPMNYPGVWTTAFANANGSDCRWTEADAFTDLVEIQVLPGGAWAQAAGLAAANAEGSAIPTPAVAGVPAGGTAVYEHVDSISLDIVIGGNWIKLIRGHGPSVGGLDDLGVLTAVAAKIAALH